MDSSFFLGICSLLLVIKFCLQANDFTVFIAELLLLFVNSSSNCESQFRMKPVHLCLQRGDHLIFLHLDQFYRSRFLGFELFVKLFIPYLLGDGRVGCVVHREHRPTVGTNNVWHMYLLYLLVNGWLNQPPIDLLSLRPSGAARITSAIAP